MCKWPIILCFLKQGNQNFGTTVDGRNPAPLNMVNNQNRTKKTSWISIWLNASKSKKTRNVDSGILTSIFTDHTTKTPSHNPIGETQRKNNRDVFPVHVGPGTLNIHLFNGCFNWMLNQIFTSKIVGNHQTSTLNWLFGVPCLYQGNNLTLHYWLWQFLGPI